jgi:hypothetical protein
MLSAIKRLLGYFGGYWITPSSIWLRQREGWVELPREEIAAIKFKKVVHIVARFYGGQRVIVSLFGFSIWAYDAVLRALRDSLRQNQQTRGLWDGAKIFEHHY